MNLYRYAMFIAHACRGSFVGNVLFANPQMAHILDAGVAGHALCRDVPMAHPQSTSHESLTIAINLRKAANRLPYMNAERMAAFPLPRTHRCPRVLTQVWGRIAHTCRYQQKEML
ncbi:MAG: hypothetical protein ACLVEF_03390 [Bifidobacterium bifidum]